MPDGTRAQGSTRANPNNGSAWDVADALRHQTQSYVEKRKADAARIASDAGEAIRDIGTSFEALPQIKALFDQAALGVDDLAADISRRSFGEMYDEIHAAVRRRPALATAAAALAGFALFRLVNSPASRPGPRSRAVVPVDSPPTSGL